MLKELIAYDTEWSHKKEFLCASTATPEEAGVWDHFPDFLKDPNAVVVMHNAKSDIQFAWSKKVKVQCQVHDTYAMAKVVYEHFPSYSLDYLMYQLLGDMHVPYMKVCRWFQRKGLKRADWDYGLLPEKILHPYAKHDAVGTLALAWLLWPVIQSKGLQRSYELERAIIQPVCRLERNGLSINVPWVIEHQKKAEKAITKLVKKACEITGKKDFNINSVPQIADALLVDGIEIPLTEKGNPCFNAQARKGITHPLVQVKEDIAEHLKDARTYCPNFLEAAKRGDGKAFPNLMISLAATRRFSSRGSDDIKINWQNIPESMHPGVRIPEGEVGWFYDYKQIENVIHIFYSKDGERRKAYEADPNWSEYIWLAERILREKINKEDPRYRRIKSTKLGMNYGLGRRKFAKMNNLSDNEAFKLFAQVSAACPAIKQLQNMVAAQLSKQGYVEDVFGYRYHGEPRMAYKIVAYMIQGCAAALMKAAMVRVSKISGVKMRLTIHDSLFFTTKGDSEQWALAKAVKAEMEDFSDLFDGIPIRVETKRSFTCWGEEKLVEV